MTENKNKHQLNSSFHTATLEKANKLQKLIILFSIFKGETITGVNGLGMLFNIPLAVNIKATKTQSFQKRKI